MSSLQASTTKPGIKPVFHLRTDLSMAAHVDAALQLQSSLGTLCALEFMKAKGIPPQVTARVLGQPQKRRLRD
ncbi:hypothetical protein [Undibacterium umbellatum]|uniref:Uncharacterized protein n=1 Tax=Undibacterium umbellatum TaxID=2762300 RepID=A0ABR6ZDT6_9BURK|nr:hypothetical protein [Undibacterium umbellatum]MBC3909362.1 hypothetical protein [Undibacterium umbellatum]